MTESDRIITVENVAVRYGEGEREVWALRGVSLEIGGGKFVSVTGPSGSGKSTLLNVIAGLEPATSGEVYVDGRAVGQMEESELARMRCRNVAYVFQFFNLLPTLTALQNVAVPLRSDGLRWREIESRVMAALDGVGMLDRAEHYPAELSGGEMQRVAIARAMATNADVILADEPTGNLDSVRGQDVLDLLRRAVDRDGRSVVLVTHDLAAAASADRMFVLRDGRIIDDVDAAAMEADVTVLERS